MSRPGWTWHNLWSLLTINFEYKYFHNSVDWSGLYLQEHILSWLVKNLRFKVFRLVENVFVKLSRPWHDLIIKFPSTNLPMWNYPRKILSPICHEKFLEKGSSVLHWFGRHYALAPLENHVGVYVPSIFVRNCALKLDDILNLAKRVVWQNMPVGWSII